MKIAKITLVDVAQIAIVLIVNVVFNVDATLADAVTLDIIVVKCVEICLVKCHAKLVKIILVYVVLIAILILVNVPDVLVKSNVLQ